MAASAGCLGTLVPPLPPAPWRLDATIAVVTALLLGRAYGGWPAARFLTGFGGATCVQQMTLGSLRRQIGPEQFSAADLVTYSRATCGAVLVGLLASGVRDRPGAAGRLGYAVSLGGATALDWLDGPLARRAGSTRLGAGFDIEADSWLTLWCAAAATAWGGLPRWCLLPPLLRYLDPLVALRARRFPAGGGPWWARLTGAAQMALFLTALTPLPVRWRRPFPATIAGVVSIAQTATLLWLLVRRRYGR